MRSFKPRLLEWAASLINLLQHVAELVVLQPTEGQRPPDFPFELDKRHQWIILKITPRSSRYTGQPCQLWIPIHSEPHFYKSPTRVTPTTLHLEGCAGLGKTRLLHLLEARGHRVDFLDLDTLATQYSSCCRVHKAGNEYTILRQSLSSDGAVFCDRSSWLANSVYAAYSSNEGVLVGGEGWDLVRQYENIIVLGPSFHHLVPFGDDFEIKQLDKFADEITNRVHARKSIDSEWASKERQEYFNYTIMTSILFFVYANYYDLPYITPLCCLPNQADKRLQTRLTLEKLEWFANEIRARRRAVEKL